MQSAGQLGTSYHPEPLPHRRRHTVNVDGFDHLSGPSALPGPAPAGKMWTWRHDPAGGAWELTDHWDQCSSDRVEKDIIALATLGNVSLATYWTKKGLGGKVLAGIGAVLAAQDLEPCEGP